jgi:hypothetical protein
MTLQEKNALQRDQGLDGTSRKRGTSDADILLLLSEAFRTRENKIDNLLDLSLSILSSAPHFPQKAELEASLTKALFLVRTFA